MIKKIDPAEFEKVTRKSHYTSVMRDIDEFQQMPDKFCEIDVSSYKSAASAASSYKQTINRLKTNIDVISRGGRAFMVKKEVTKL